MEARAQFRGASVSKTSVAVILVIVALGLATMGGYVLMGRGGAAATQTQRHIQLAPGTVLRQDWPAPSKAVAPSGTHRGYRGGPQPIDDVAGSWSGNPGYDAGDVREGHGV